MDFKSILYKQGLRKKDQKTDLLEQAYTDLHLDQVVAGIIAGKERYDLRPFFYDPLQEPDTIYYRQQVMQDLENEVIRNCLVSFADSLSQMRQVLANREKYAYLYQRERAFLDAVIFYSRATHELFRNLSAAPLKSDGLLAFKTFLQSYLASDIFQRQSGAAESLLSDLKKIRYEVLIDGLTVNIQACQERSDYNQEVKLIFDPFKYNPSYDYSEKIDDSHGLNHVDESILKGVAMLYPEIFNRLLSFPGQNADFQNATIMRFDREIQFYLSFLAYIDGVRPTGLPFCYPQLSDSKEDLYNTRTFDLALAHKLAEKSEEVVENDFYLKEGERILMVTGPNQGGKTTFSRVFGQVHYLAALGCPVPGAAAKLFLFDHIFTHFEKKEEVAAHLSKFEDDLLRIHRILEESTPRSIIILNEIFSSTSLEDAIFLCQRIMEKVAREDNICVWVTFIDELVALSKTVVSMVSLVDKDNPAVRTFKIVRRQPDGLAYALSIAEKYKVTYSQLKARLKK